MLSASKRRSMFTKASFVPLVVLLLFLLGAQLAGVACLDSRSTVGSEIGNMTAASGLKKAICLLVEFSDVSHIKRPEGIQATLDQMAAYWNETSYGLLNVSSTVTAWYRLPRSMNYYGRDLFGVNDIGLKSLVTEAVGLADDDVDFRLYDYVMTVHSGSGQEVSSLLTELYDPDASDKIWSCMFSNLSISTDDGVVIEEVAVLPEFEVDEGIRFHGIQLTDPTRFGTLGVFAHEFGHLLGLPDLYDKKNMWGEDKFVGDWDLMASGAGLGELGRPCHPSAWSKTRLGWTTPKIVIPKTGEEMVRLSPLELTPNDSVVMIPVSNSTYYLVEFRTKSGFDDNLPEEGVLITFVDETEAEEPRLLVMDSNSVTETKDDAAFHAWNQFGSGDVHVLVVETNRSCSILAISSKVFSDSDNDGLFDAMERHFGTDPTKSDTDDDALSDDFELRQGTDPLKADTDEDGVNDGTENEIGTSPTNPDSDGDYWPDGIDLFPTNKWFPTWILVFIIVFSTPTPLSFLFRKHYGSRSETWRDTLFFRGNGVLLINLGLLSVCGTILLHLENAVPFFSFAYFLILIVALAWITIAISSGLGLAKKGKQWKREPEDREHSAQDYSNQYAQFELQTKKTTTDNSEERLTAYLKKKYAKKGYLRPEQALEFNISKKIESGLTRREAVERLYSEETGPE